MKKILRFFLDTGMICPSTHFLVNKILNKIDWKTANKVVLLGFGNGVFVKGMLNKINPNVKLYIFDINKDFIDKYKVENSNFTYINDSAEFIEKHIGGEVDVIISTLPFFFIPKDETKRILLEIKKSLKKDGQFLQYQYFLSELKLIKDVFKKDKVNLSFEPLNLPPAFIYSLKK